MYVPHVQERSVWQLGSYDPGETGKMNLKVEILICAIWYNLTTIWPILLFLPVCIVGNLVRPQELLSKTSDNPITICQEHILYQHMCLRVSARKKILALTHKHKCHLCHVLILTRLHSWRFVLLVQPVAVPSPQGRSAYRNWQKAPSSKFFHLQLWTPLCSSTLTWLISLP